VVHAQADLATGKGQSFPNVFGVLEIKPQPTPIHGVPFFSIV
jgi:hypothetical protein